MRRVTALLQRDWISISRDVILLYMMVAPILIPFLLRFLLPATGQTAINVVVTENDTGALAEGLSAYAYVETVPNQEALNRRVLAYDDTVGILSEGERNYRLVLEGNENHDSTVLPAMALQAVLNGTGIETEMVEVGEVRVPYRAWVGAFLAVTSLFLSSVVLGFIIIEDKETRMMQALGVTPLTRSGYLLTRSLLVIIFGIVIVPGSLFTLGLQGFPLLPVLVTTILGTIGSLLFGFYIGAMSGNQIVGIANLKIGFTVIVLPPVLTLLLPQSWWVALYWAPSYWIFTAFKRILVEGAGIESLWVPWAWIAVTSLVFLALGFAWLQNRLDFAYNS